MLARKKTALLTSTVVALTLSLTGVSSAYGATGYATSDVAAAASVGVQAAGDEAALDPRLASSTDLELLLLIMTGRGVLADAHPELIAELGITVSTQTEADGMAAIAAQFLAASPAFSATRAPAIRSTDPAVRDQGISGFMTDFMAYVMSHCRPSCTV
ncbi:MULTISPECIES: hypothetical protein [Microbacterium]|uniref:hypothetical protein n=1 Tax=Microbacterium TaxID=33882 RepID=UPI000B84C2E2|nr:MULTISPECIES: hypothetical protein [Microbacterium]NJI59905.1 hypothetical protein [Microbacterium sp. B19(2022)]